MTPVTFLPCVVIPGDIYLVYRQTLRNSQYIDLRVQRSNNVLTTKLTHNFKRVATPLSPISSLCLMGWVERSD